YHDESVLRLADTKLRGLHNIENLMATLAVGMARGLSFGQMVPPLSAYEPRSHRCEFVREVNGVAYVNDSKATNLDAVEKAFRASSGIENSGPRLPGTRRRRLPEWTLKKCRSRT